MVNTRWNTLYET